MTIYNNGPVNQAALVIPDVYLNVNAPPPAPVQGVPSNGLGIVGTANWGPVNSPVTAGSPAQASQSFGPIQNRAHDILTAVSIAALNGASVFKLVRVTDGSDVAASAAVQTNCITLTAKYTGSLGNSLQAVIAPGSAAGTTKITLSLPGLIPETFDNLSGSGNALWVAMAAAINNGQGASRGPSQLAVAAAGVGTTAPTAATTTLTGGTDGATTITSSTLIGVDGVTRSGMYALRGSGAAIGMLAECATPSTWSVQLAFGLGENMQMVDANAAGDTPASFATAMGTAGVDNPWMKAFVGDWAYWLDSTNNVTRLVSPAAFYAGRKVSLPPEQSALNKPLLGIVGTQKTLAQQMYSTADLQVIAGARGDVITNPVPGGAYFGCRFGRNTSSDAGRHQDAYTTLTDFLAVSLNIAGGSYVGQLMTPTEQDDAQSSISAFLQNLKDNGQIGAFSVAMQSNNATGVQTATVAVTYLGVIEYFIINLTGGSTVVVANAATSQ